MTDHRILRSAGEPHSADKKGKDSHGGLTVFDDASGRMPLVEAERARGIALMTTAWNKRDEDLAATALSHLLETVDGDLEGRLAAIDDIPLLEEFAAGYLQLRDFDLARRCWKRILEIDPNSETALMGIAKVAEELQDLQMLGEYLDKLLAINPTSEDALTLLVKQRHFSKDTTGAMAAAEHVLLINPTIAEMRAWLVEMYRRQGNADKAREHEEILSKMGAANPTAAPDSAN